MQVNREIVYGLTGQRDFNSTYRSLWLNSIALRTNRCRPAAKESLTQMIAKIKARVGHQRVPAGNFDKPCIGNSVGEFIAARGRDESIIGRDDHQGLDLDA